MRIVSLLPSATEILFALGAGDDVVGVTIECDHPPSARSRRVVSDAAMPAGLAPAEIDAFVRTRLAAGEDLYRLDEGALRDLAPDLIVTQDLCAVCAVDVDTVGAAVAHLGCQARVLTVAPQRLDEVLDSISVIGAATGRPSASAALVCALRRRLEGVVAAVAGCPSPRVAVLEWTDPPFSAGHWVPDLVVAAGGVPVLGAPGRRSQAIDWVDVAAARPRRGGRGTLRLRVDGRTRAGARPGRPGQAPRGRSRVGRRCRRCLREAGAAPRGRGRGARIHLPPARRAAAP